MGFFRNFFISTVVASTLTALSYGEEYPSAQLEEIVAFSERDIAHYAENCGTAQYAVDLSNRFTDDNGDVGISGSEVVKYFLLGIVPVDVLTFVDTEKPNAVVVYPAKDEGLIYYGHKGRNFLRGIDGHYDVHLVVASEEAQVYRAIESVPDIELFVLGGHGLKKRLGLGTDNLEGEENEKLMIDIGDIEFGRYLRMLHENAVIF